MIRTLETSQLGIAGVARGTHAGRIMVDNVALGIGSAVARINTRAVNARVVSCAFAVRHTLGHDLR